MTMIDVFRTDGRGTVGPPSQVAESMQAGMRASQMRTLDTLQKDEWLLFDEAVVGAAQESLVAAADLQRLGLTFNVPNGLGTTVLEWQDMSEMTAASVSMDGATETEIDRVQFNTQSMPLPLIHHGWRLSRRVLEASRRRGESLDTSMADAASRQVSEKIEDVIFSGLPNLSFSGGSQVYGYTTHPDRSTVSLSTQWDASAKSPVDIKDDVVSMVGNAQSNNFNGPFILYVPSNYASVIIDDYTDGSGSGTIMTIRQRLEAIEPIQQVKVADKLPDDNVVLVQMTRNVVDLVNVLEPTTVEWSSGNEMVAYFMVMASQLPRIKSDANNVTGVVHLS